MSKFQRMGVLGVRVLGASVALTVLAVAANCGGGDDGPAAAVDSGGTTDAPGTDTPVSEGGKDTGGDAVKPPGDSAVPDFTATLVSEGVFEPLQATGMTTDDFFIAVDDAGNAVAIPAAGGAAEKITDNGVVQNIAVWGKVVFVWKSVNKTTNVGTLVAWTKAGGAKTVSTASILGEAAASDDGSLIVYSDNARSGGKVFDYSISASDGSNAHKAVITQVMEDTAAGKCTAQSGFAGNTAVVAWCMSVVGLDAGVDAGVDVGADVGGDAGPTGTPGTIS